MSRSILHVAVLFCVFLILGPANKRIPLAPYVEAFTSAHSATTPHQLVSFEDAEGVWTHVFISLGFLDTGSSKPSSHWFLCLASSPPTSCTVKFEKDKGTRNNACRLLLFACGAGGCCFSYIVNSPLLPHNPIFSRGFVSSLLFVFQPACVIFNFISPIFSTYLFLLLLECIVGIFKQSYCVPVFLGEQQLEVFWSPQSHLFPPFLTIFCYEIFVLGGYYFGLFYKSNNIFEFWRRLTINDAVPPRLSVFPPSPPPFRIFFFQMQFSIFF